MNSNKRKDRSGLVGKKIRHRDGSEQTHYVKDGSQPKSSRADRVAARPAPPVSRKVVDVDSLRDAVAFDDYDALDKMNAFERGHDYVNESIEVHGGSNPKVILTRDVYIGAGHPERGDGNDWQFGEAEDLAQAAFDRGDHEVDADDVAIVVRETWDDIEENAEPEGNDDEFANLRSRLEDSGFDLEGVEVKEVQNVTVEDRRPDLEDKARDHLNTLWAEADLEDGDEEQPSLLAQVLSSPGGRRAQGLPVNVPTDHPILDPSSGVYDANAARLYGGADAAR